MTPEPNRPDEREAEVNWYEFMHARGLSGYANDFALFQAAEEFFALLRRDAPREGGEERRLTKPATVGSTTFGRGVKESLVIDRAQREYEYQRERHAAHRPQPAGGDPAAPRDDSDRYCDHCPAGEAFINPQPAGGEVCGCGRPAEYSTKDGGRCCNKYGLRCAPTDAPERDAVAALPAKWREDAKAMIPESTFGMFIDDVAKNEGVAVGKEMCADELSAALAARAQDAATGARVCGVDFGTRDTTHYSIRCDCGRRHTIDIPAPPEVGGLVVTEAMIVRALNAPYGNVNLNASTVADMLHGGGDEEVPIMRAALTAALADRAPREGGEAKRCEVACPACGRCYECNGKVTGPITECRPQPAGSDWEPTPPKNDCQREAVRFYAQNPTAAEQDFRQRFAASLPSDAPERDAVGALVEAVSDLNHAGRCRCWQYGADEDRCECGLTEAKKLAAALGSRPVVDEGMVERACDAYITSGSSMVNALIEAFASVAQVDAAREAFRQVYDVESFPDGSKSDNHEAAMRAALTAALRAPEPQS